MIRDVFGPSSFQLNCVLVEYSNGVKLYKYTNQPKKETSQKSYFLDKI